MLTLPQVSWRTPTYLFIIHHHVSLRSHSNQRFRIWILARRGGERVPGRCMHKHKHSLWQGGKSITTHIYSNIRWGFAHFKCADIRFCSCVKTFFVCFLSHCACVQWSLHGVWAGSGKTMEGWWGCFTAVGRPETDCDPTAIRPSASHGLWNNN